MDAWQVLRKIETLIERLPYKTVQIKIETSRDTYTLDKERRNVCGFIGELKEGG